MTRLPPGSILGRYQVIAHIGSGGMGEVYRARDTTLDKTVALKTIAAAYAQDPASRSRFERERRLTASLEHPHICRLLDAGREAGIDYLTMEYLAGESLAARLEQGRLSVDQAIGYAIEIADALAYAHAHGVIHRDLKPANVFLTPTGAKVLDFGLAKLRPTNAAAPALAGETAPLDATQAGTLVGSAPYMPPERLEGHEADVRSDVFAFGVLLYEMLAGRRAFDADTPAALIATILLTEPAPLALDHPKANELEWIVRGCIAKNPDSRWQSIADVEALLKRLAGPGFTTARPSRIRSLVAAATLGVAVGAGAVWLLARGAQDVASTPVVFAVPPPPGGAFTPTEGSVQAAQLAVAPDGRSLAFVASGQDGVSRIWLRDLESISARPVAGTENATYPFWSPDARALGFFADKHLRRIDLTGGPSRPLAPAPSGRGGSWSADGRILFAPDAVGPIRWVAGTGGTPADATRVAADRGENSHRWPVFLPDGRRFLYFAHGSVEANEGVYLASLDGNRSTFVAHTGYGGVFLPPDYVLFLAEDTLLARRIDFDGRGAASEPIVVAERVGGSSNFYGAFSASATGVISYATRPSTSDLVWVDRSGRALATVSASRQHVDFRLSSNGEALASADVETGTDLPDIYAVDLTRGTRLRVTASRATDGSPVWAPDGRRLVYRSNREGVHHLFVKDVVGNTPEQPFHTSGAAKYPTSWSSDGQWIAFHTRGEDTQWDVAIAPATGVGTPRPLLHSRFNEVQAQFSPDGRWVAYTSDESGRDEVYVQSIGDPPWRVQISVNGGDDPHWRGDGGELFYVSSDGHLTAVALRRKGQDVVVAPPDRLFRVRPGAGRSPYLSSYDVARGGDRFLIRVPKDDVRSLPLTVLVNRSIAPG